MTEKEPTPKGQITPELEKILARIQNNGNLDDSEIKRLITGLMTLNIFTPTSLSLFDTKEIVKESYDVDWERSSGLTQGISKATQKLLEFEIKKLII